MYSKKRIVLSILYIILGAVLFLLGILEVVDSFWSGMGGGLLAVGILQAFRLRKYSADPHYREQTERANKDERNLFLAGKAWSWAGVGYVMIAGIGAIVFKLMEQDILMQAASGSICLIVILYWFAYLYLNKKY